MFEKGVIYIAPNLKVNELLSEGKEEELIQLIEEAQYTDPTIEICTLKTLSLDLRKVGR